MFILSDEFVELPFCISSMQCSTIEVIDVRMPSPFRTVPLDELLRLRMDELYVSFLDHSAYLARADALLVASDVGAVLKVWVIATCDVHTRDLRHVCVCF